MGDDVLDRETDVTKQLAEAKRFLIATYGEENDVADGAWSVLPTEQPWLAWVVEESWGSNERWLKCLMCSKWVQDHDGGSTTAGYVGAHGSSGVGNQKDHKKMPSTG